MLLLTVGNPLWLRRAQVERERSGNFNVEAPVAGAYKWCFRNQAKTKTQKTIAFNLHVGDSSATAELANIGALLACCCAAALLCVPLTPVPAQTT